MTRPKAKPVRAWAVKRPDGSLDWLSVSATRREALINVEYDRVWPEAYRLGYRAVRVKIEEDTP